MKKAIVLLFSLLLMLASCKNNSYRDVDWSYLEPDYAPSTHAFTSETDAEAIKRLTESGYLPIGNVAYYYQTDHYNVRGYYGHPSTIQILDEIDGLPVTGMTDGFSGCTTLETLIIGKNLKNMATLTGCSALTNIVVDKENKNLFFENNMLFFVHDEVVSLIFSTKNVKGIVEVPNYVTHLSLGAFDVSTEITKIIIGKDVNQFYRGNALPLLDDISISEDNRWFYSEDGVVYSKEDRSILYICSNHHTIFEIPSYIDQIDSKLFANCQRLSTLVINDKIKGWGDDEYHIVHPEYSNYYIYDCNSLEEIIVNQSNPYISSFEGCVYSKDYSELIRVPMAKKNVHLFDGLKRINVGALSCCHSINVLDIPDSVNYIGERAAEFSSIKEIILGSGINEIHDTAFAYCNKKVDELYYHGTIEQLSKVEIHNHNKYLVLSTRYYYSEEKPTERGRYWHYVDGAVTKW